MNCTCHGMHGWKWHTARGLPQCAHTLKQKQRAQEKYRKKLQAEGRRWTPGSPILIPEVDPL